jgi:ubiquinol-cytochrome c reductase cytochrome c subunit
MADFQLSTGRMPLTDPSVQAVRKPVAYRPAQIDALVAYVGSLGGGPPIPDVNLRNADIAKGFEVFRINCAPCHSSTGNGGALSYGRAAPELHKATSLQIAEAVRSGPGQMPVFGPDTLTDDQVDDVVAYVRSLRDPADPGGFSLGHAGPIPEGLLALLVGVGGLVFIAGRIEAKS